VDPERLEHHLQAPQGHGHVPAGAHTGAAGGAACGDLVSISLRVEGERVADAGFAAAGCGAAQAAGSAAVELLRGRPLLDAARLRSADVAAELGGLSPGKLHAADLAADALHRALGAAAREQAALPASPRRTLVAMSGGVDSAVAALACAETGEAVAVTLELWSDPENDGERSCCSAAAVRGARTLAHDMGLPHLTIDLREEFRAGVVEPWIAAHAAGETPNPCVRCNGSVRLDAMLDLAGRLGAARLATGHYARTAEDDHPSGPLLRAAADAAKDQSYMLAALPPASLARMRFPLGALEKSAVRARAAAAGLAVAATPDSQDLCFLAGTGRARFLRRHGGLGDAPGDIVDSAGRVLGRHRGAHHFTVGQRKGLGVAAAEPLYVLATEGDRVLAGPRAALRAERVGLRDARLHRSGARVDRVKLRYRARPLAAHLAGDAPAGAHAALTVELAEPADRGAPGQLACLMDGDVVVGWGTIA
jgi:tRNA-specific 2-thiouridylase